MVTHKYTVEELQYLRDSPLVRKPDGLPSIDQWMDVPADQANNAGNNNNRRSRPSVQGDGDGTGETRAERPFLMSSGSMGNFGRRMSTQNDATVLGPPKLAFTSASRNAKASENTEKRGAVAPDGDLGDRFPRQRNERWSRDRDADGGREKTGYTNGRRAIREEGEGWTNVKGRKSLGQDDFDRGFGRNGDRDREKSSKDAELDNTDNPPRRTGGGARDKFERWGRRDEATNKDGDGGRIGPSGQGGWRDREQNRERDRDNRGDRNRDWTRGEARVEENPEWMDAQTGKEKKKAHTQEEFQRWKESMRAKDNPAFEKEEPKVETAAAAEPPIPTPLTATAAAKPAVTPSAMEPLSGGFFGNWAKDRTADGTASPLETGPPKTSKDKKSKFMQMQMFKKAEEPAPSPNPAAPTPASFMPQENASSGEDADKQGFQRILEMLGNINMSGAPTSQQGISLNEGQSGGASLMPAHQSPPPDERKESRQPRQQVPRTLEQQIMLDNILSPKPSGPDMRPPQGRGAPMSPENALYEHFGPPRQEHNRAGDESPFVQPPPRNSSAQDVNLQALLNSRTQQEMSREEKREREFLLNLMQQPSRATPPQPMSQPTPGRGMENHGMSYFDQGGPRPMQQAKGRPGPPPGFMEDPRFMNENEMLRRDQHIRELNRQQEEVLRAKNSRMPMGFNPALDDPAIAHLQRRNTGGDIPRQMTNMGIPSQPVPDLHMFGGRGVGNPGMPPTPQERPNVAPPPGFGGPPGGIRQAPQPPPGLGHGPQIPFPGGNPPLGHPPGFVPPPGANIRGMFPGGPGQNQMPPQGPPQGFFPPPNFPPPMGMRGAEDPRMMMGRPDFEQYGAPGPRQGGRPPNMY